MVTIVLDACTVIDLDIPQIDLLTHVMKLHEFGFNFLITETNYTEVHSVKIRRIIENSGCVEIKKCKESHTQKIADELETLKINLSPTDRQIVILAIAEKADFIATSDIPVCDKADRYRKIKRINYMRPITTVGLIHTLLKHGIIDSPTFLEKTLALFKFKEIDNVLEHLLKQNPSHIREEYIEKINWYKEFMRERFQIYKDPLVNEYKGLS